MTPTTIASLVALGLVLLGGFFLVGGVRTLRADRVRRRTWRSYPGEVVASRLDDGQVRCQIGYRRVDGTTALFWSSFTSTVVRDPVGRPVQVLENPADPHQAVVGGGIVGGGIVGGGIVGTVFAVVGAGLLVAGLVVAGVLLGR